MRLARDGLAHRGWPAVRTTSESTTGSDNFSVTDGNSISLMSLTVQWAARTSPHGRFIFYDDDVNPRTDTKTGSAQCLNCLRDKVRNLRGNSSWVKNITNVVTTKTESGQWETKDRKLWFYVYYFSLNQKRSELLLNIQTVGETVSQRFHLMMLK